MRVDAIAVDTPGNPDILRTHIDRGLTFDKVAAPDPAAAPLGTDDEAAGSSSSAATVADALRTESRPAVADGFYYREAPAARLAVCLIFVGIFLLYALIAIFAGFR